MREVRLLIQVDTPGNHVSYHIDGLTMRTGARLAAHGWTWITGPERGGLWTTTDPIKAAKFASLPTYSCNTGLPTTLADVPADQPERLF